jgi:hypothetical protein
MTRKMSQISVPQVFEVVSDFDESGGASLALVAWGALSVDEQGVIDAWEQAQADGLIKPAGNDLHGEQMWRLTVSGWAALRDGHHDSA